jgi:hypothetical protein
VDAQGEVDVTVGVVGGQGPKIERERGYLPAKSKTERNALGIALVFKSLAWEVVWMCRVRWM